MLSRSAAFDEQIKFSHVMVAKAELWIDGNYEATLTIDDGNVKQANREIRRRCDLSILDPDGDMTPDWRTNPKLVPAGNELKVFRGIRLRDGTEEYLPQGVFVLEDVRVDSSGDGHRIRIDSYDRARRVQRAKLVGDYVIAKDTNYATAIQDIILLAYSECVFDFDTVEYTTPRVYLEEGADLWKEAQRLATSIGYEVYFDASGVCVLRQVSNLSEEEDWRYSAEDEDSMLLYLNKRLNSTDTFNHIIVTGESSDNEVPYRGEAIDDDPASPTYYYGPFGKAPKFEKSPLVQSDEQAVDMAQGILEKTMGIAEDVNITSVVHPAHEVGDTILLGLEAAKLNTYFLLDTITMPMTPLRGLNAGCRIRRSGLG